MGVGFVERNLESYDFLASDEAFFCSTPFGIMPVSRFNGRAVGTGAPGAITMHLLDALSENDEVDIAEQGLAAVEAAA